MIYLIGNIEQKICKIGFSEKPEKRLRGIQTGCPYRIKLINKIIGLPADEKYLHRKFVSNKLHGEWFDLTDEILNHFSQDLLSQLMNTIGYKELTKYFSHQEVRLLDYILKQIPLDDPSGTFEMDDEIKYGFISDFLDETGKNISPQGFDNIYKGFRQTEEFRMFFENYLQVLIIHNRKVKLT